MTWLGGLTVWTSVGLEPDAYWRQTPRLMHAILRGRGEALDRERQGRAWLAWQINNLSRTRKMPALDKFAEIKKPRGRHKPQTWQQMKEIALMWNAVHNGEVKG